MSDHSLQDELRATVEHLAAIERPSASDGERRAADWIAERFRAAGLPTKVEEERVHGGFWWPIGLLNLAAVVDAGRRGRLLSVAAFALLVDDLDHRTRIFRRLALPKRSTWNVTAEAGEPDAPHTVVIVAHHDAAHGGMIFDTRAIEAAARHFPARFAKIRRWPRLMRAVLIGPLLVALGARRLGTAFALGSAACMVDIARAPVVPGANDNLAAVALLLALAGRRYDGTRLLLVSAGSEESNSEGMQAWGRRHFPDLPRETTTFVALETLGSGHLAIAEGEGFLVTHDYTAAVKDQLESAALSLGIDVWRELSNSFASDGQIPLHAGYPTALLGALDDLKLPANYHKPWDTPDRLDLRCLEDAVRLIDAFVRARSARP